MRAQWGDRAVVQRCLEHKIRNVRSYLPNHVQDEAERRMRAAYGMKTYGQASKALKQLIEWLNERNEGAARSLAEGLEQTLTVHRLALPELLRASFRSANPIESMFDKVEYRSQRVKSWAGKNQVARWIASSLLLHEKKFRRIRGFRQMSVMYHGA